MSNREIDMPVDLGQNLTQQVETTPNDWAQNSVLKRYLGETIMEIRVKNAERDAPPNLPEALTIDYSGLDHDRSPLPFDDGSQDSVVARNTLEVIEDYRTAIADWFRVTKIGGHLIIIVPHQFLYERKFTLPSSFNAAHRRLYTAASLMQEVEEAISPISFRVRQLYDNDKDYDYTASPDSLPSGYYEIVLVIEKMATPAWSELLPQAKNSSMTTGYFSNEPPPTLHETVMMLSQTNNDVGSILVMKQDHRGDFILAERGFRLLRQIFPNSRITLVCGHWNVASAKQLDIFDEIVPFSIFAEVASLNVVVSLFARMIEFRKLFAGRVFDLAIDFRVDPDTRNLLAELSAKTKAGFGHKSTFPFLDIALPLTPPTADNSARRGVFECRSFTTNFGTHSGYVIVTPRLANLTVGECIIYGPYKKLEPGIYKMNLAFEAETPLEIGFDIACNGGNTVLYEGSYDSKMSERGFLVQVNETITDLEIRVRYGRNALPPFRFYGCGWERSGVIAGPHQSELAILLGTYVAERMRYTADITEVRG